MEITGAYEAKTHLPMLLKRVAQGESFTITRHGVPVAVLKAPETGRTFPVKDAIAKLLKFRGKRNLDGLTIREMIEDGRR
jgi:antitoxin (DNA-binding transcriptional repressor) of toxin-antitoxin stability system